MALKRAYQPNKLDFVKSPILQCLRSVKDNRVFDADGQVHYYVPDFQGNTAMDIAADGTVVQQTHYYPYGEPWSRPQGQPWLYGGKERELRGPARGDSDFGARNLAAARGSFAQPDPLAEMYPHISPYAYCAGNPLRYTDPSGCYFTPAAIARLQKLRTFLSDKIKDLNKEFLNKLIEFVNSNRNDKDKKSFEKSWNKLYDEYEPYFETVSELNVLEKSSQAYDIGGNGQGARSDDNGTTFGFSFYNFRAGKYDIMLYDNSLKTIAHELKHAYQFEIGNLGWGEDIEGEKGYLFYDTYDEKEAFLRGNDFPGPSETYMDGRYYSKAVGKESNIFKCKEANPNDPKSLQDLANKYKAAFRVNGVTYRYQIQQTK